jgi:hypothetical protein
LLTARREAALLGRLPVSTTYPAVLVGAKRVFGKRAKRFTPVVTSNHVRPTSYIVDKIEDPQRPSVYIPDDDLPNSWG